MKDSNLQESNRSIVEKEKVVEIFNLLVQYFDNDILIIDVTDIGDWELIITELHGTHRKFRGSMLRDILVYNINVAKKNRELNPIMICFYLVF